MKTKQQRIDRLLHALETSNSYLYKAIADDQLQGCCIPVENAATAHSKLIITEKMYQDKKFIKDFNKYKHLDCMGIEGRLYASWNHKYSITSINIFINEVHHDI